MNLGLLISLGITLLLFGLLFLYVKHSVSKVNTKLTSLFRIVEEEVEKNNKLQNSNNTTHHPNNTVTVTEMNTQANNTDNYNNNNDDDDDTSSYTDFDDDDDDDDESQISYVKENLIEVSSEEPEQDEIKIVQDVNMNDIEVPKTPTFDTVTKGSLNGNITQHINNTDTENDGVIIVNDISSYNSNDNSSTEEPKTDESKVEQPKTEESKTEESNILDTLDISKLPVAKLRTIVEDKSLHENPKKLKKAQLVDLLKQN